MIKQIPSLSPCLFTNNQCAMENRICHYSNSNLGEGVFLCNNNENCYNINNHVTFDPIFNPEYSDCSKAEVFIPGDDICVAMSELQDLSYTLFELTENWEAFICLNQDDDIKDCTRYYSNSGWHGGTDDMKKIIVQPKLNTTEFNNFYADKEYVIAYDEPNYNGNHIIYSLNTIQNNSIHRVRSIETSSPNIRTYLNINSLEKTHNYKDTVTNLYNHYNKNNDKYLTNTDSTSFIFDEQTLNNGNNYYSHSKIVSGVNFTIHNGVNKKRFGYKSIRLDIKKENKFKTIDVENGGVEVSIKNFDKCEYITDAYSECDVNRDRKFRKLCYVEGQSVCDYGYLCHQNNNEWNCVKDNSCTEYNNPNEEYFGDCSKGYICNMYRGNCELGCLNDNQCDYDQYCDLSNGSNRYNQDYCEGDSCLKGRCLDYPSRHLYSSIKKGANIALAFPMACESSRAENSRIRDYCEFSILDTSFDIKINENWEAYYCPINMMTSETHEILRDECVYLDEGVNLSKNDIESSNNWMLNYYLLGGIFINPKNYDKFIQYHGHSEYGEKGTGSKGYIELFTEKEFKGKREVIWKNDYDFSDNLIPGDKIKSIKIVGNINPLFVQGNGPEVIPSRDDISNNNMNISQIHVKNYDIPYSPKVKVSNTGDTPAYLLASGFFNNVPIIAKKEYLWYNDDELTTSLIKENEKQAESFDGADLVFITAHGHWQSNRGSSQSYIQNGESGTTNMWNPLMGGSLGDLNAEWILTPACQSLGKSGTSDQEAIWGYRELFVNGLHGFGGYYKNSNWESWTPLQGSYNFKYLGYLFWTSINHLSIGKSWVKAMYNESHSGVGQRNAGFITVGNCDAYLDNDDFWKTIYDAEEVLADPSKKYLKENGFCYYSKSAGSGRFYSFYEIIGDNATGSNDNREPRPEENWPIYNDQGEFNIHLLKLINANYQINIENSITLDKDELYYFEDNRNDNIEIDINSNSFNPKIPEKQLDNYLIEELLLNAYSIIELVKEERLINNLYLGDIKIGYGLEQEFSYYGKRTKSMINEILFTFYFHNGSGYFLNANSITIGFNPIKKSITTIKSDLKFLNKNKEFIHGEKILNDLNKFESKDKINKYVVLYIKIKNEYRPAILKIDSNNHISSPVKVY